MPDYSRFHVSQKMSRFTLLDQDTGWVWKNIRKYDTVLAMMNHLLPLEDFKNEEYKRLRKLTGEQWEQELEGNRNHST